jgi:HAD superfamily phosphoserine phosphatase-like hydrolase
MHRLAIYDMDKTITRTATFGPFLLYAVPRLAPWRIIFLPLLLVTMLGYAIRIINRARLKEINLGLMLGHRIDGARLAAAARGFAGHTLSRNMLVAALDRMAADKAEGYRIVIASASYAFYVAEVAGLIGVSDVIATRATRRDDTVSPIIDGENCYATAKCTMVKDWMAAQGIARGDAHIRFYSDHVSDAPCHEFSDEAFATNPHPPLRRLAQARGWTVFDWA